MASFSQFNDIVLRLILDLPDIKGPDFHYPDFSARTWSSYKTLFSISATS
jgi:hypothetical protein